MTSINLKSLELWFITGSQHLYGPDVLLTVAEHSKRVADALSKSAQIPVSVTYKQVVTTPDEISRICADANHDKNCIGVITWMHTFSPAKMWINGLKILQKPLLHLHTQFNRDIPWSSIDMDFMNLNQSAHGDREFGHIMTKMRLNRKVVVGHWQDKSVHERIGVWARATMGWYDMQGAKFVRFGDNMRQVAVTDGDKVDAEIKFGFSVNTHGIGDLVGVIKTVKDKEIDALIAEYDKSYTLAASLKKSGKNHASLRAAAKIELGMEKFLVDGGYKGFTDTFEDLHGMEQLPGIASQRLMAKGYGFGGEGDWKTSAMVRTMKFMATGLKGGNSFMEDYTYHFEPKNNLVLGSHMLEICPSIAATKPTCEIHPLGIGGKADPVRLVFTAGAGAALNASLVDLGDKFRLLVNTVDAVAPKNKLPKLPVARVLWKPHPDMQTGCAAWILAGGAHHTVYSQNLTQEHMEDFSEIANIELITINKETSIRSLKQDLAIAELLGMKR